MSDEEAAFTVLGAVGLQSVRLAQPALGENFVVYGMGLVGLMIVQILKAHGCRVLGIDINPARLELAREFGAETIDLSSAGDPVGAASHFSRGLGVDGVIIAASTASNDPVHHAARMCRKRGRIVLVGVTGLHLSRADFYEKELTFQVSCSYGPGRYDPEYEVRGNDYPIGYVRWTEQRNFEAVLEMLADGRLNVRKLISHRFPLEKAGDAYALISGGQPCLGVIFEYGPDGTNQAEALKRRTIRLARPPAKRGGRPTLGFIGAGEFAARFLMPLMRDAGARLKSVASLNGTGAANAARKFGFEEATTDLDAMLGDDELDTIVIATPHDTHAALVCRALRAGKNVFVEKPLAVTAEQLAEIEESYHAGARSHRAILMVGFNRRFAPQVRTIKSLLAAAAEPKAFIMTVNAGASPDQHWLADRESSGGRIIGEACHFIDLLRFLAAAPVTGVQVASMGGSDPHRDDAQVSFTLSFSDGSIGTVHYLANGHRSFAKERLEVFCGGRVLQLENFRRLTGYGWLGFSRQRLWRQDKGHRAEIDTFLGALCNGGAEPIPFAELFEVTQTSFAVAEAALRRRG